MSNQRFDRLQPDFDSFQPDCLDPWMELIHRGSPQICNTEMRRIEDSNKSLHESKEEKRGYESTWEAIKSLNWGYLVFMQLDNSCCWGIIVRFCFWESVCCLTLLFLKKWKQREVTQDYKEKTQTERGSRQGVVVKEEGWLDIIYRQCHKVSFEERGIQTRYMML